MYKLEKDKYGNIVKETYMRDDYKEVSRKIYEKQRVVKTMWQYNHGYNESTYDYEYDAYDNPIKLIYRDKSVEYDESDTDTYLSGYIHRYINTYNEHNQLISIKEIDEETQEVVASTVFEYNENRIQVEKRINPKNECYFEIMYKYNADGHLDEKEYTRAGVTLYYEKFTYIEEDAYYKKQLSPIKSNYEWVLTSKEEHSMTIDIYNEIINRELLEEIYNFIVKDNEDISFVYLCFGRGEHTISFEERIFIEQEYKRKYNLETILLPS